MRTIPFFSFLGLIGLLSGCTAKLITPPPGPIALSGVVQLARVRNATVQAFALSESGAIASTALAETLTNENGEFQLSLPAGTGPVVIRSSGGKYENEADGVETDASELSNIVDASKTSLAPVTALTTLAKERTLELLESSGSLENAQQAAKAQVGQLFGLSAEALDAIPAPPKAVTMSNGVDAVQGALALAALSHFMKSYFPSKTISEVMSALIQDIKTDGSLNGDNEAGNLQSSLAQSLAFRWNTQRANAVTAAKLNPNLAFKDFNLVEVSSLSFESQGLLHKTVVEGVYYLGGVKTTLPESGTGVWNDMFYSMGEIGSGFFEGSCYVNGADTMSLVAGSGFCAGDSLYYIASVAQPGLNESGTGQSQVNSLYYVSGSVANEEVNGLYYQAGSLFSGTNLLGVTYLSGARLNGLSGDAFYSDGLPALLTGFSDFAVDLEGNISAIKREGGNFLIQYGPLNNPKVKVIEASLVGEGSESVVRSRSGNYTAALFRNWGSAFIYVMDGQGVELKRFQVDELYPHSDSWIWHAVADNGRVAVTWQAGAEDGNNYRLRIFDAAGTFDSGVIGMAANCGFAPHVALNPTTGSGVVTCQNHAGGPIYYRLFDSNGNFSGDFGWVTNQTSWYDSHLVTMNSDGYFAVVSTVWNGGKTVAVFFDSSGTLISSQTIYQDGAGRYDTTRGGRINIDVDYSGNFALPWLAGSFGVSVYSPNGTLIQSIAHAGSEQFATDSSGNRFYLSSGNVVREMPYVVDGLLFTGSRPSDQLYYYKGFPMSGLLDNIEYKDGIPFTGKSITAQYFVDGVPANGVFDNVYYLDSFPTGSGIVDGVWYSSGYPGNGISDGIYYSQGLPATGAFGGWWWDQYPLACYTDGLNTGEIQSGTGTCHGIYFVNYYRKQGIAFNGTTWGCYADGVNTGTVDEQGTGYCRDWWWEPYKNYINGELVP